ncbi:hypothetical protein ERK19_02975 [Lactobacillus helsingborgensis]|uniref:hypothetical protein n=1 Tax=Lactobacillus helsingborgensis TaxID=1218494 RepID=UPI001650D074|nr:hypothetical protein [Lactobacillus helsingborgensis]MBC6356342.1 hypothetical protein [Lactobacillus helsingborgensis]
MSFWGIVGLVFLAVVILSFIFALFHMFFMILPAALVIIGIIWLINHFTKKDDDNMSANSNFDQWHNWGENKETRPKRKKVRDAKTKDVDK